jgi:uncharacterized membrane protein YphA (DoxX/SURF4 family)
MTLLRAAARTMLASYFVASGIKALRDPDPLVPAAEPVVDKIVPLAKQYAPDQVASAIPEDTATLVRINGAVQVVGGLALASGKGRRLGAFMLAGSLIPNTIAKHPFWTQTDPEERAEERNAFLKNVSLLGGVILAARDTEGKPGIAWRAQTGSQRLAKKADKASAKLAKKAGNLGDSGSDFAEEALAGGAALVTAVAASSRRARKKAAKQLEQTQKAAAQQAKEARKAAARARKEAPKQLKAAKKAAAVRAKELQEAAAEQAKQAKVAAAKQAKAAKKQSKRVKKNIQLGEN